MFKLASRTEYGSGQSFKGLRSRKWCFWSKVKALAERKMSEAWMGGGNCDSCCPNCKQWESSGNAIKTVDHEDDIVSRTCLNCGNEWGAIFTPAGFIPIDYKPIITLMKCELENRT